jgi:hypothetical protein
MYPRLKLPTPTATNHAQNFRKKGHLHALLV